MPSHNGPDHPPRCPSGYHWDDPSQACIANPSPPPVPPPIGGRLGNPSVSDQITFTYAMPGTQPSGGVQAQSLEPFPPIPGGEMTDLTLVSDKGSYTFGADETILTATLLYAKDNAPVPNRVIVFAVAGETFVQRTGPDGVAKLIWKPFGVPGPDDPTSRQYFAQAVFFGY